ncbi:MAG: hypothetical protein HC841_01295 [Verrucomicrobiae bacterium]|nr:hypothetical protein [Verrucomicrobiae bacterium]
MSTASLKFYMTLLALVASILIPHQPAFAGNRGGAQAVVFPRWNSASVANLVAAVNEAAPAGFELSQCPFFGGDNRWANTVSLLKGVNANIGLVGTFFLSFHTDQPGHDLGRRAGNLNTFLITSRSDLGNKAPVEKFKNVVLSPQLEDNWNDDTWKLKVEAMLDKMDEAKVLRSGKLSLRRSVNPGNSSALNGATYTYKRGSNSYPIRIRVEVHSSTTAAPATGSWSNDGPLFVYFPNRLNNVIEDANSAGDGIISQRKPLENFIATARARSGAATLWRPAMNLWKRTVAGGRVSWTRTGIPNAWERSDSHTSFDAREKAALKAFLIGIK